MGRLREPTREGSNRTRTRLAVGRCRLAVPCRFRDWRPALPPRTGGARIQPARSLDPVGGLRPWRAAGYSEACAHFDRLGSTGLCLTPLPILAGVEHAHDEDRAALDFVAQFVGAHEKAPDLVRLRRLDAASNAGICPHRHSSARQHLTARAAAVASTGSRNSQRRARSDSALGLQRISISAVTAGACQCRGSEPTRGQRHDRWCGRPSYLRDLPA